MGKGKIILGWFNAWIGYVSIFLFLPSFLFFFSYKNFLERSFQPVSVSTANIEILKDSSKMKIVTDKGVFYHYNKDNFESILNAFNEKHVIEIWVDEESRIIADLMIDNSFLLKRSILSIILYLIGLVFSGGVILLSTILVIKTKGWGTYELMEKHKK
jgi:hypothetical protein